MADSYSGKSCMKPLNERNYPTWKIHMRMCLVNDKLWDIVQGTETISSTADEAARRKFESRRDLALATIVLGVDQSQLYLLGDPTDPVEVWRKLQNTFQKKSWANKFRLKKKLFNMKLENGQNLQDHIKVFVELFEELAIIGDAMEEEERVIILLSSLPERFSTLITALEAHEKIPAWEVVTERLLKEERRQRGSLGSSDSNEKLLVSFKRNKKLIKCFECGKEGHIKRQCRVYEEGLRKENRTFQANKAVDARSSSTGETIMFTSAFPIDNVDCDSWIVNSGGTQHMCNKKSQFSAYSDLSSPVRVEIGNDRVLKGVGVGDVRLKITLPNLQVAFCTKEIDLVCCPSNDMLADIFTKGLSAEKFSRLRRKLGVVLFEKHIQCEKEC
ncbi:Zinc finger CCHC-type [Trinorchestia longiramus]|nr:Zinc finger CCHC-type [Trinorchestia longiramus]